MLSLFGSLNLVYQLAFKVAIEVHSIAVCVSVLTCVMYCVLCVHLLHVSASVWSKLTVLSLLYVTQTPFIVLRAHNEGNRTMQRKNREYIILIGFMCHNPMTHTSLCTKAV